MAFQTKQQLNSSKFFQSTGTTMNLSGNTIIFGKLAYNTAVAITGNTQITTKIYVDNKFSTGSTANNGLTKNGSNFRLGGSLTGTTSITGAQILNLGTTGSRLSQFNANATNAITINSSASNVNIGATSGFVNITSSNVSSNGILIQSQNSLTLEGKTISIKGSPSSQTGFDIIGSTDTLFIATGSETLIGGVPGSFAGAKYDIDYSAQFVPRSLVDKGYVTGLTSSIGSSFTANNGLTKNGSNFRLGGTLTGTTSVIGSQILNLGTTASRLSQFNSNTSGAIGLNTSTNSITLTSSIGNVAIVCSGMTISGNTNFRGARYISDYSANYNLRSIPDVNFVTGTTYIDANNGLSKSGNFIQLGGNPLLTSTSIDVNNKQLSFTNLESVSFGSSGNTFFQLFSFSGVDVIQADAPLTLSPYNTVSLPAPSGITRSLVYDIDTNEPKYSDGNQWLSMGSITPVIVGITANTTLTSSRKMVALVDSSTSGLTITLPITPVNGDIVTIKDRVNNAFVNNISIDGNARNIDGVSTTTINTNNGSLELTYSTLFDEWYITAFVN